MSDIIINGAEAVEDPREKMALDLCETIHNAARLAETAVRSEDPTVENALKTSARVLLEAAIKKLDESVGTAVADEDDDE